MESKWTKHRFGNRKRRSEYLLSPSKGETLHVLQNVEPRVQHIHTKHRKCAVLNLQGVDALKHHTPSDTCALLLELTVMVLVVSCYLKSSYTKLEKLTEINISLLSI